jgi:hypothetical protein
VLYSLAYAVVRLLLEVLIVRGRSNAKLPAEVLALRHQLRVLELQLGRPRCQPTDRLLLTAISRSLPTRTELNSKVNMRFIQADLSVAPETYLSAGRVSLISVTDCVHGVVIACASPSVAALCAMALHSARWFEKGGAVD